MYRSWTAFKLFTSCAPVSFQTLQIIQEEGTPVVMSFLILAFYRFYLHERRLCSSTAAEKSNLDFFFSVNEKSIVTKEMKIFLFVVFKAAMDRHFRLLKSSLTLQYKAFIKIKWRSWPQKVPLYQGCNIILLRQQPLLLLKTGFSWF